MKIKTDSLLCTLLALLMLLTPALTAFAAELSIDSSSFSDPEIKEGVMYSWHKGLPKPGPSTYGVEFPVLITWDDQYFLCCDDNMRTSIAGNASGLAAYKNGTEGSGIIGDYDYKNNFGFPNGWGNPWRTYSMSENGLLANLGLNYEALKEGLPCITLDAPENVPVIVPAYQVDSEPYPRYALGFYWPGEDRSAGPPHWVTGHHRLTTTVGYSYIGASGWELAADLYSFGLYDSRKSFHINSLDWYLRLWNDRPVKNWIDPEWTMKASGLGSYPSGLAVALEGEPRPEGEDSSVMKAVTRWWTFGATSREKSTGDAYYTCGEYEIFQTDCTYEADVKKWDVEYKNNSPMGYMINWIDRYGNYINLLHYGSGLLSKGLGSSTNHPLVATRFLTPSNQFFKTYWGEPVTISYLQKDFTVVSGQVTNLDGPIVIGPETTIIVEDGGVLSVSGWIINNGQILVKPGGTLLVQPQETAINTDTNACISSMGVQPGGGNGRIACDGNMIVMPDCKVFGAGTFGLQFGEGAQVVNYGVIGSENFDIYADHTIDNRGEDSIVITGRGVDPTVSGYDLMEREITSAWFDGSANQEKTRAVRMPYEAVYGRGQLDHYDDWVMTPNRSGTTWTIENSIRVKLLYDPDFDIYFFRRLADNGIVWYDATDKTWYQTIDGEKQKYPESITTIISRSRATETALPDGMNVWKGAQKITISTPSYPIYYFQRLKTYFFTCATGQIYYFDIYSRTWQYYNSRMMVIPYVRAISEPTSGADGTLPDDYVLTCYADPAPDTVESFKLHTLDPNDYSLPKPPEGWSEWPELLSYNDVTLVFDGPGGGYTGVTESGVTVSLTFDEIKQIVAEARNNYNNATNLPKMIIYDDMRFYLNEDMTKYVHTDEEGRTLFIYVEDYLSHQGNYYVP